MNGLQVFCFLCNVSRIFQQISKIVFDVLHGILDNILYSYKVWRICNAIFSFIPIICNICLFFFPHQSFESYYGPKYGVSVTVSCALESIFFSYWVWYSEVRASISLLISCLLVKAISERRVNIANSNFELVHFAL